MGRTSHEFEKAAETIGHDVAEFFERRFDRMAAALVHCGDHPRFVTVLGGAADIGWDDGRRRRLDRPMLIGPSTRAALVRLDGPVHLFGAILRPGAWGALCGDGCIRMNDVAVPAAMLLGAEVDASARVLADLPDFASRVRAATGFVQRLRHGRPADPAGGTFAALIDRWLAGEPRPRVDTLVDMSEQSRRQVERQCKTFYGVPPRMIARRHRALRAAKLLARAVPVEEVIDHGFYDQSHLIRELKHFTGLTPRRVKLGDWAPKF